MIQRQYQLCSIEFCLALSEAHFLSQMVEELPSIHEIKHEVYSFRGLKSVVERYNEGMLHSE